MIGLKGEGQKLDDVQLLDKKFLIYLKKMNLDRRMLNHRASYILPLSLEKQCEELPEFWMDFSMSIPT
jgi:hypothetical protein